MIRITDITPDKSLKELLDGKITLPDNSTVKVYRQGERPTTGLPKQFIDVLYNGAIRSFINAIEGVSGTMSITVYVQTLNNTINFAMESNILQQIQTLIQGKVSGIFIYSINLSNIVTGSTTNLINGYSGKVINLKWHVIPNASEIIQAQTQTQTLSAKTTTRRTRTTAK